MEINNNTTEELDIINISDYGDALRNSGYKNIESAMAEIVDNSIQAEATEVMAIIKDKIPSYGKKLQVHEIAFLDNGKGMNIEWVQRCLRFGSGTRYKAKGMGRFGVGLPQSSLYACPRVEVYSWQDTIENSYMSYLDINLLNAGEQLKLPPAQKKEIPEEYKKYFNKSLKMFDKTFDFTKHGTLVIWRDCDNVEPRTASSLFGRLEFSFGQKYRYLICDGKTNIYLIHHTKEHLNRKILPNDPLFLMTNNIILGNPERPEERVLGKHTATFEPLFEPFSTIKYPNGIVSINIDYLDNASKTKKTGVVTLKFSVVKEKFYDQDHMTAPNPGNTPMGEYVGKLEGISVVREGREIDFGEFGFYSDKNSPFHRWWGCEICFDRDLDQVFKVANNKQHVELIALDGSEYEEDEYKPIWLQLEKIITTTISNMQKRNKDLRKGSRTVGENPISPAEETATKVEEQEGEIESYSGDVRKTKSPDELEKSAKDLLADRGNIQPNQQDIDNILFQTILIKEEKLGDTPYLFTFSADTGLCICKINSDHIYYKEFVENVDIKSFTAFQLLIASFVKTADEAPREKRNAYKALMDDWNYKMNKYIRTYLGLDK